VTKKDYEILIIFYKYFPDITARQPTVQFLTSPNVGFCTTLGKKNKKYYIFWNITFIIQDSIIT